MIEVWTVEDIGTGYLMCFGDISIKLFSYKNNYTKLTVLCMTLNKIFKQFI